MTVLAIDPGPVQSAYVIWDGERVLEHRKLDNDSVLEALCPWNRPVVIEMVASYGMPVGAEVFETCVWIGRFLEALCGTDRITRMEVKHHLCHSSRATDANIRQAILDRFGGKAAAIGTKRAPGPLYGVHADEWAALALALTWWDRQRAKEAT